MINITERVNNSIKQRIKDLGLKPSQVAVQAGVDMGGMSRFMRDINGKRVSFETAIKLMRVLNYETIHISALFDQASNPFDFKDQSGTTEAK